VVRERGAGHDGPHRALLWPARWWGEADGEEEETVALELGVERLGAQRSGENGSTRCGMSLLSFGCLLKAGKWSGEFQRRVVKRRPMVLH
jgi:hypothetical protein